MQLHAFPIQACNRVIGNLPRTLAPAEKNYHLCLSKFEFLAFRWAVLEKFHNYLVLHSLIYTDNNPLIY